LFQEDEAKSQQLEILREEVAKGFAQLVAGISSNHSVMDVFEQASLCVNQQFAHKRDNANLQAIFFSRRRLIQNNFNHNWI
jgi:antitoxin ParD1/3/4